MTDGMLFLALMSAATCCLVGVMAYGNAKAADRAEAHEQALARLNTPLPRYRSPIHVQDDTAGERSAADRDIVSHYRKHDQRMTYLTNEELLARSDAAFERLRASAGMSDDEVAA